MAHTIKKSQDALKNAAQSEILLTEEKGYLGKKASQDCE
jgi:hypothetical protein